MRGKSQRNTIDDLLQDSTELLVLALCNTSVARTNEGEGRGRGTDQTPLSTTFHVDSVRPSPASSIGAAFASNEGSSKRGRYVEIRLRFNMSNDEAFLILRALLPMN